MRSLAVVIALGLATAAPAAAQDVPPPGADEYTQRIQEAMAALITGDIGSATSALEQAQRLDAARPEAPYYVAVSQRMGQDTESAVEGFRRAAELARAAHDARWEGRALSAVAATLERIDGRLTEARDAWQAYVRFADANSAVAFPQLGRARVQAITIMTEQEAAYVTVRERIAEREREAANPQPARQRRR